MNLIKRFFLLTPIFLFVTLYTSSAFSQISHTYERRNLSISPVVGYERVQKIEPEPRTKNRLYYGIRANYGPSLFSLEAEVTQARDSESFPDHDLQLKETATTGMLGIRSSFVRGNFVNWYLRGGGHARKVEITQTQGGVTSEREPAIRVSPYAGTGLILKASTYFQLDAGVTVIFTGRPSGSDREYRTSLGFSINI